MNCELTPSAMPCSMIRASHVPRHVARHRCARRPRCTASRAEPDSGGQMRQVRGIRSGWQRVTSCVAIVGMAGLFPGSPTPHLLGQRRRRTQDRFRSPRPRGSRGVFDPLGSPDRLLQAQGRLADRTGSSRDIRVIRRRRGLASPISGWRSGAVSALADEATTCRRMSGQSRPRISAKPISLRNFNVVQNGMVVDRRWPDPDCVRISTTTGWQSSPRVKGQMPPFIRHPAEPGPQHNRGAYANRLDVWTQLTVDAAANRR